MLEISALIIGFMGSFHCVTMCGPIALALSGKDKSLGFYSSRLLYNMGRVTTYMVLGVIAGMIGHSLLLAGFQNSISIIVGILIVLVVITTHYFPGKSVKGYGIFTSINQFIRKLLSKAIKGRSKGSLYLTGIANGILPCGFVYLAMAGASATQTPAGGAFYMFLFGSGTIPAMMMVSIFGSLAGVRTRSIINKAAPVFMIILGALLIYRGFITDPTACPMHQQSAIFSLF